MGKKAQSNKMDKNVSKIRSDERIIDNSSTGAASSASADQQIKRDSILEGGGDNVITPQLIHDMREKEIERERQMEQRQQQQHCDDDDDEEVIVGRTNMVRRVVTPHHVLDQHLKEIERQEQQQDRPISNTLETDDDEEEEEKGNFMSKPGAYAVDPTRTRANNSSSAVAPATPNRVVGATAENNIVKVRSSQQQQQQQQQHNEPSNNDMKTSRNRRREGRSSTSSSITTSVVKNKRSGSPGLSSSRTSRRKEAAYLPSSTAAAAATTTKQVASTTQKGGETTLAATTSATTERRGGTAYAVQTRRIPARRTMRSRTPPPPPQREGGDPERIESNPVGNAIRMEYNITSSSTTDNTTASAPANNNNNITVEPSDDSPTTTRMSTSRSNRWRWSSTTSIKIEAQKVDDAEAIFYAEDAHVENFRRRLLVCGICAVAICAITITLALVFRPQDDPCDFDDKICCVDFENEVAYPRVIPLLCHCVNSTESIYESFTSEEKEIREFNEILFVAMGLIEQEVVAQIDPRSCHPYNQAMLAFSKPDELGLNKETITNAPISVLGSLLAIFILFVDMDGIHWENSGGWLEHSTACDYLGIDCLFIDTISTLLLQQNGLKGTIPTEIGLLPALRGLDLSSNSEITGRIPTEMESMKSLQLLDLSGTSMSGPIPTLLGSLTSLNNLNLGSNNMSGTIPSSIFQLSSINFLSLSNNKLHGTLSTEFGRLTDLDVLRLNLNNLSGSLPSDLVNMSNLGLLHIGNNKFLGTVPDFLGEITSLRNLDILNSGLTGQVPETFCTGYWRNNTNTVGLRQIVMDCGLIARCSCCDSSGNRGGVRIICSDNIPDVAIGNGV